METDTITDLNSAADALTAQIEARASGKAAKPAAGKDDQNMAAQDAGHLEAEDGESEDEALDDGADADESDEEEAEGEEEGATAAAKPAIPDDLPVTVKVNGEEREVPFAELRKGYMMGADYTRKTQELATARREFFTHAQQHEAGIKQRVDELGFLAQTFVQQLTEAEAATDWNALRQANPAEYAARQQDIQQRKALLQRAFGAYQQAQQQQQFIQQQQMQQTIAEQAERLVTLVPEWLDASVATREKGELAQYLTKQGMPEEQVNNLTDALAVALARKAMLYDKLQAGKQQAVKAKQPPIPKFTGTGARDAGAHKSKAQKLAERAKRSGSHEDFGAMLAAKYSHAR